MTLNPPGASPGGGSAPRSFHDEVCQIREDLDIWRLAVRRAGSFDLAEDALQDTFYAVARVRDPERIENLRAFFCRALIRQIAHLRGQLGPLPVEDPEAAIRIVLTGPLNVFLADVAYQMVTASMVPIVTIGA